MTDFIRVQPSTAQRVEFARWAVGQSSRIRTISEVEFAVPADLFTLAPEYALVGALVDGHPYRAVEDELGPSMVVTELDAHGRQITAEEAGIEVIASAPGEGRVNLESLAPVSSLPDTTPVHACADCDKTSTSAAGLAAHRRAKHVQRADDRPEPSEES